MMHLGDIGVILFVWYLKAFTDAILFGKKPGEWAHEVWHIGDWVRSWTVPLWMLWRVGVPWGFVAVLATLSFGFNHVYLFFRWVNVSAWDDRWRVGWLEKWLDRGGIV